MSDRPVLGIDLGTTYSCAARLDENERPTVLKNSDLEFTTPSVVYYDPAGTVLVGKAAKAELATDADRVAQLVKQFMGVEGYTIPIGGRELYPQEVSSVVLRYVVEDALKELGEDIPGEGPLADVVITVPAYFSAAQRQATRDAGTMAGLNVMNIINEPTAAAIAYGIANAGPEKSVLVYDLGGGTFDVTVITVASAEIRVIATGGDAKLGGALWDNALLELIAEEFMAEHPGLDPRTDQEAGSLSVQAEDVKKQLSAKASSTFSVTAHGERVKIEITRRAFVDATTHLMDRTVEFTQDVWEKARRKGIDHLDELLLVGGMSRAPFVLERLREEFPDFPKPRLVDPEQIVAKGAALYAVAKLREVEGGELPAPPTIINVASRGYGVKVVNGPRDTVGHVDWLIHPNDELPTTPRENYRTVHDNQESVEIVVFESLREAKAGESLSEAIDDHTELVRGVLKGIPRTSAGESVAVSYVLGDDGILHIEADSHGQVLTLEAKVAGATPKDVLETPLPHIARV